MYFEPSIPAEIALSLFVDTHGKYFLLDSHHRPQDLEHIGLTFIVSSIFRPYDESLHAFVRRFVENSSLPSDFPADDSGEILSLLESPFNQLSMLPGERTKWNRSIRVKVNNEAVIPVKSNLLLKIRPEFDGSRNIYLHFESDDENDSLLSLFVDFNDILNPTCQRALSYGQSLNSKDGCMISLVQRDILSSGVTVRVGSFQNTTPREHACMRIRIEVIAASKSVISVSVSLQNIDEHGDEIQSAISDRHVFDIRREEEANYAHQRKGGPAFLLTHIVPELSYVRATPQSAYEAGWAKLLDEEFTFERMSRYSSSEKIIRVFETIASLYQFAKKNNIPVEPLKRAVQEWGELIRRFQSSKDQDSLGYEDSSNLTNFTFKLATHIFGSFSQPVIFSDLNGTLAKIVKDGNWEMFEGVDGAILDYLSVGLFFVNTGATVENVVSKWLRPSRIISISDNKFKGAFPQLSNMKLLCRTGVEMLSFSPETYELDEYSLVSGVMPHDIIPIIEILDGVTKTIDYSPFEGLSLDEESERGQVSLRMRNGVNTFAYSPVGRLTPESREGFLKDQENHLFLYRLAETINLQLEKAGITSIFFARSGDITIDGVPCNKAQTYQNVLDRLPVNTFPIILDDMFFSSAHQGSIKGMRGSGYLVLQQLYERALFLAVTSHNDSLAAFGDFCGDHTFCVSPDSVSKYIQVIARLARIRVAIDELVPPEFPRI